MKHGVHGENGNQILQATLDTQTIEETSNIISAIFMLEEKERRQIKAV